LSNSNGSEMHPGALWLMKFIINSQCPSSEYKDCAKNLLTCKATSDICYVHMHKIKRGLYIATM